MPWSECTKIGAQFNFLLNLNGADGRTRPVLGFGAGLVLLSGIYREGARWISNKASTDFGMCQG